MAQEKVKAAFGDRIKYIDQKRFVLQKGEYIADQKQKKIPGRSVMDGNMERSIIIRMWFFISSGNVLVRGWRGSWRERGIVRFMFLIWGYMNNQIRAWKEKGIPF